jgi:ATP-dependent Lhr-like helicase
MRALADRVAATEAGPASPAFPPARGQPTAAVPPAHGQPGAAVVVLAAADPASAYGAALPWPARPEDTAGGHRPGRKAGALVVLADGQLVLYVERGGKTLLSWTSDADLLGPAAAALAAAVRDGALGRLTVESADGTGVYDSPLARALEAAGFRPTPRGLRMRG